MSEELATGTDFTLANHGLKPAPTEPGSAEPETYGAGIEGALVAANDLTLERGSSETEPVERFLEWKTGSKAGERVDLKAERMSLTTEQAAKTLTEVHRTEDAIEAHSNLSELQREADLARAQLGGPEHVDGLAKLQAKALLEAEINAEAEAALMAAQPEGGEQPSTGIDADFAALLERKPQLRAQLEAPFQQAERPHVRPLRVQRHK